MTIYKPLLTAISLFCVSLAMSTPLYAQDTKLRWYKGNTHTHSSNSSDGDSAPDDVARWYRQNGYQFLFLTDHDEYWTDPAPLNALLGREGWFLVLPGQEISHMLKGQDGRDRNIHINGLFTVNAIPHAAKATPMGTAIAPILAQNGIVQINHPNYGWILKPDDLNDVPDGALIEIWNGIGVINNLGGDDGEGDSRPASEGFWDHLLSKGKVIWGVGADDAHVFMGEHAASSHGSGPGKAWIMLRAAELTPHAIRASLTKGDFYASTGVVLDDVASDREGLSIKIKPSSSSPRYQTRFIGKNGEVLAEEAGTNPQYHFRGSETYVRASIIDSNGNRAWTQPIFLDGRKIPKAP